VSRAPLPTGPTPPAEVLTAFGAAGPLRRLDGGMRRTWCADGLVLKPVDGPPGQHAWVCDLFDAWPTDAGVRVPSPVRTGNGDWAASGWGAHRWLPGSTARVADDPAAFRRTADAFHEVLRDVPRPDFLDHRDDAWTHGDRVAFEEADPEGPAVVLDLLAPLLDARRALDLPAQVVHGDLGGNVLRHPGLPDAVIDWPPYVRPTGFALGIVVGDAVAWEGAPRALVDVWDDVPGWHQLLLRAVICRIATRGRNEALGSPTTDSAEEYVAARRPSVELVLSRVVGW
jgi:uncharacterized protein (TIGR02569 family)